MNALNWQPGMTLASAEKAVILQALRFHRSNREATASAPWIFSPQLPSKSSTPISTKRTNKKGFPMNNESNEKNLQRSRGIDPAKAVPAGGTSISCSDAGAFNGIRF